MTEPDEGNYNPELVMREVMFGSGKCAYMCAPCLTELTSEQDGFYFWKVVSNLDIISAGTNPECNLCGEKKILTDQQVQDTLKTIGTMWGHVFGGRNKNNDVHEEAIIEAGQNLETRIMDQVEERIAELEDMVSDLPDDCRVESMIDNKSQGIIDRAVGDIGYIVTEYIQEFDYSDIIRDGIDYNEDSIIDLIETQLDEEGVKKLAIRVARILGAPPDVAQEEIGGSE